MKKPSFALLRGAILTGLLCTLGGALLVFWAQMSIGQAISELATIGEGNAQINLQLTGITSDLATANAQLIQVDNFLTTSQTDPNAINNALASNQSAKSVIRSAKDKTDVAIEQNNTRMNGESDLTTSLSTGRNLISFGMGLVFLGIILLFIGFIQTFSINTKVSLAIKENFEQGRARGNQEVIAFLDKNPSALMNMVYWIRSYRQGKINGEAALHIFEQIFARLQEKFGLQLYGKIGEILIFDHQKHDNRNVDVKQGDRVRVIETGWQMGNIILRKPMVEKERG